MLEKLAILNDYWPPKWIDFMDLYGLSGIPCAIPCFRCFSHVGKMLVACSLSDGRNNLADCWLASGPQLSHEDSSWESARLGHPEREMIPNLLKSVGFTFWSIPIFAPFCTNLCLLADPAPASKRIGWVDCSKMAGQGDMTDTPKWWEAQTSDFLAAWLFPKIFYGHSAGCKARWFDFLWWDTDSKLGFFIDLLEGQSM